MKTEHVIRIKNTKEVLYTGTSLDDCKKEMKPAFFNHIDAGKGLDDFPLEAVTIHELEESEMDTEEETTCAPIYVAPAVHFECPGCGEIRTQWECPGCEH